VVGAGAGGLLTAARLARLGYRTLVAERLGYLGGRASTRDVDGFKVNNGAIVIETGGITEQTFAEAGAVVERGGQPAEVGAGVVISDVGPAATVRLIGPGNLPPEYTEAVTRADRPCAMISVNFASTEPLLAAPGLLSFARARHAGRQPVERRRRRQGVRQRRHHRLRRDSPAGSGPSRRPLPAGQRLAARLAAGVSTGMLATSVLLRSGSRAAANRVISTHAMT